ncbi:N(6)-adenine-specific methyltransferase METTL4 isoform X1 [Xyrauchen texanus]|uniref:N(6)-adenine-specific methyltransferase METTL4 isoform X1 n=1 Tax=Xyrauchen texanus TaxID=154827 RepID=UPI0022418D46|nr:N(6)-adenine-specific methyltransferase METTL4 isoform X1 [Xyrauchen texanus]
MSIVFANSWGWLLDTCSHIDEGLQYCMCALDGQANTRFFKYSFKRHYFDISRPHITAKQNTDALFSDCLLVTKNSANGEHAKIDLKTRKKRKRKQRDLNAGELNAHAYHEKIRSAVLEGSQSLVEAGCKCGYLTGGLTVVPSELMPVQECQLAALCDMAKPLPLTDDSTAAPVQTLNRDDLDAPLDLFSYITENPYDCAYEVTLMRERYLLPPRSRFLLSDITRIQPLVNCGDKFDLIVLDPPWENKSVKRSNRYGSLPSSQLKQLPVRSLAAPGCVVVTWVTNRAQHLRFVREELYPHWGVEGLAEWLWVKVTRSGEFVFPLDSQHKKPYEVLVLGRYPYSADHTVRSSTELPEQRLLISVPSILHSHKPSLSAVLKPYVNHQPKCLELFARSLRCDWTSWGNEVIKFQHSSYFTKETIEEPSDTGHAQ